MRRFLAVVTLTVASFGGSGGLRDPQAALRKVQQRVGATVDGVYGPQTRDRMKWHTTWGSSWDCMSLQHPPKLY